MTVGIYKLEFKDSSFYIGRSVSIETRYKDHKATLRGGRNHSIKLQTKYNELKQLPILSILEVCSIPEIKIREEYWIKELNATVVGLNVRPGGDDLLFGEKHPNSKYTNLQVLEVVKMLGVEYNEAITHEIVSEVTGVSISTIKDIITGRAHLWIKDEYPELYSNMLLCKNKRRTNSLKNLNPYANKKTLVYPDIISPDGIVYTVEHLTNFCNEHGLTASNLSKVFKGERVHHKGWKLNS